MMNVLCGLYKPTSGQIFINEKEVHFNSPKDAIDMGIGMVHQHFMLIQPFTVTENIILGMEPTKGYTDPACHHAGGELLPRLFILTYYCRRLFSVALSLRFPSQDVILHHCSMEPGLSSYAVFRHCYTRLFNLLFDILV